MVTNDYGKLAYLKITELENRIEKLEKKVSEANYTELEFNYSDLIQQYTHEFFITINALKEGTSTIKLNIDGDFEALAYTVEIKVNDVHLMSEYVQKTNQKSFSLTANLNKGENLIKVTVQNDSCKLNIYSLKLNVSGFVEYLTTKNYLSNVAVDSVEYVLHFKKDVATLFSYSVDTGLVTSYTINSVLDCKLVGAINGVLYIAYIDANNNLFLCAYDLVTGNDEVIDLNVTACSSVAGYPCDNGVKLFYSKFAKIYSGVYIKNLSFISQYTGGKGLEVYADSNAPNAIVIVDNFLNAKFVTD